MELLEYLVNGLKDECPDARFFQNIWLDSKRGKGAKADLIVLHASGLYLIELEHQPGRVYGNGKRMNWVLRKDDGTTAFFPNPVVRVKKSAELLARKCNGTGDYIQPVVIFSEESLLSQVPKDGDVRICNADDFPIILHMQKGGRARVPAELRDTFAKQLKMLELLSK